MTRNEIVQTLREFKQLADRARNAGPYDAHVYLGKLVDYIDSCPTIKEYISKCKLEIPEEQVGLKLKEFVDGSGYKPLLFGNTSEGEIAFLYRAFTLLRNDIDTIRRIGFCWSHVNDGAIMMATFGEKLILPFYNAIENHFNRCIDEIESSDDATNEVNYNALDSLIKEIEELYACVSFSAPLLVKWRFKVEQKLSAIFGSESKEVLWFANSAFPASGTVFENEKSALAETLGRLQRKFTKMRNQFTPPKESRTFSANHMQAIKYAYDVFISHANANKASLVDSLEASLRKLGINIWYDTDEIDWGDSLKTQIDNGLRKCRFGIIVISPEFLGREWTEKELNELLQRQNESGEKVILPLLYDLTVEKMKESYPALADFKARIITSSDETKDIAIDFARILIRALKAEIAQ